MIVGSRYQKKVYDDSKVKKLKFLGYCKCGAMITTTDLETLLIYNCYSCGLRARKNTLLTNPPKDEEVNAELDKVLDKELAHLSEPESVVEPITPDPTPPIENIEPEREG